LIFVKNTQNYTGVTISGDQFDLDHLYHSLHVIVGSEGEWSAYESARIRVLGICYDLRHAIMGHREVEFVENGLNPDMMRHLATISSDKNTYFSTNVLWPELLFVSIALNDFIEIYAKKKAKDSYEYILDHQNIWDPAIAQVRGFQASIAQCLIETIPPTSVSRILRMMNYRYSTCSYYATQYLDELNCKFIAMDKEKRLKNITIMAKRIAEQGSAYQRVKRDVTEAAREYNCEITEIAPIAEYPDTIEW
jgi:hypothetical protein